MKKIISILSLACLFLSIQSVNARSIMPVVNLPSYCFAVNVDNADEEIELELLNEEAYSIGNGVKLHVAETIQRVGGTTINGVVSGLAFAGGGSQSWRMNLSVSASGLTGKLYRHTNSWYGGGTAEYEVICE